MKKNYILTLVFLVMTGSLIFSQQVTRQQNTDQRSTQVIHAIDNNGYWRLMAEKGLATLNAAVSVPPAVYTGSGIRALSVITEDSPDVPTAPSNTTQSENSIFVDPNDNQALLNSNNSTPNPSTGSIYGADGLTSGDGGLTWGGTVFGVGTSNWGDPAALIGLDGTYYVGYIKNNWGQQVARSSDQGATYQVATVGSGTLDKNHLWIDNKPSSPYTNYLYDAWTDFDGSYDVELSRSTDGGVSWSNPVNLSSMLSGYLHHGVNVNSGPNGEVYAVWAIYNNSSPLNENAIGFARSLDGGATFEPAIRAINNILGIREVNINKNMRKNSFPSMTVDISGGVYNGNIYVVWPNVGVPGVNTGNDVDVYMIRSEDEGETWSTPVRVNQDESGLAHKHYMPWITCDPTNGILSVVFYDDRNVGGAQCEVFCANSYDGGATWEDFKVSDVAFTPAPIPNMAFGYMGDYLAITARGGWVYPCWTDTRTGAAMTYVSPYETVTITKPMDLTGEVEFETGLANLKWSYRESDGFSHFRIYRGLNVIGETTDTVFSYQLPDYGNYSFNVTAKYEDGSESGPAGATVRWGDAQISVDPVEISEYLLPGTQITKTLIISNVGQLPMNYNISLESWLTADPLQGTIAAGANNEINVTLNAEGLELGTYTAELNILSNDPDNPEFTVPVTMVVTEAAVLITSGQEVICQGESVILTTEIIGGSGSFTYTWISDPEGFTSSEASVTVTPDVTTTYIVEVFDGSLTFSDQVTIQVNPLPEVNLGTDITVCLGETRVLDAGEGFKTYLWSDGSNGQTLEVSETGTFWVEVTNDLDCAKRDSLQFTVNLPPQVNLGQDHAFCEGSSEMLSATAGYASYLWSTGESSYYINVTQPGEYWVVVADEIGCSGQDTITLTVNPKPMVSLGDDQNFCEGTTITLSAGSGFSAYLWDTGETTSSINTGVAGEHWVEVTDANGCTNQDAVVLTIDPLPAVAEVISGPTTVDNFQNQTSDFGSSTSNYSASYDWKLEPVEAGSISGNGTSAQVNWSTGFSGTANISVRGVNACGNGSFSPAYAVSVYSSQGIGDKDAVSGIKLYPNPNDGAFVLQMNSGKDQEIRFQITAAGGNMIFDSKESVDAGPYQKNFNLSSQPGGTYYLIISDSHGRMISRQQVVIQ